VITYQRIPYSLERKEEIPMNEQSEAAEMVAQWRNQTEQDNPAGPLFATGEFAEADIVNATGEYWTCGTACSGSYTRYCC